MFLQGTFKLNDLRADDNCNYGDEPKFWRATFRGEILGRPATLYIEVEDPKVLGFGADVKLGIDAKLFGTEKRDAK